MSTHADALAQSEFLEAVSDRNLLVYFRPELKVISEGRWATDVLPDSVVRNFIRLGVLLRGNGPKGHKLTKKGINIIQTHARA